MLGFAISSRICTVRFTKKNKMSVHNRGVVASLGVNIDSMETELHVRSWHGQTFWIKSVCKLKNKLLFWGASTDKLLLAASNDTVPKLLVFDLEIRTCAVAHRFSPLAAEDGGAIILSFACSGSGRSIAMCLFEYPTDIVVHVASVDDHGGFRVRCFQEEGFHGMEVNLDPLLHVCFLGQAASELVAVNNRNGKVFWLGSEVLNHGNEHGHGQDQSMMFRPLPFVPMQGSMLSSCHFSGDIITAVTHVCGSCIMVAIVLRRPNGNGHQLEEFQVVDGTVHFTEHPVEVKSRAITPFMTGNMVHISQEVDVGVTVRGPSSRSVLPYLYSMQLGELRQCWMEACIRAIARKFYW